jgi:hypothetical protein
MSVRRKVLGEVALREGTVVSGVDLAALVRRLILFDDVIVKSVGLRELPFLVRAFGKSGLITALDSGILHFSSEFTYLIEGIAVNGVPTLPPNQFSFGIAEGQDRETLLKPGYMSLQSVSGLKNTERSAIEEAVHGAIVRQTPSFGADLQLQVEHDLRTNMPALRASILHTLNQKGFVDESLAPKLVVHVEEVSPRTFRVHHNLPEICGVPEEQARQIVKRAVSGLNGLNTRLAEMATHSAITGFSSNEAPILFGKLAGIIEPLNPKTAESQFSRIANLADIGEPLPGSRIDVENLLEIRSSAECLAFKGWLDDADTQSDSEVSELLTGLRSKLGLVASNVQGKLLRFAAVTGLGFVPGAAIPSAILGFVDAFLIEKLFPKSGVVSFIKTKYPSVFDR